MAGQIFTLVIMACVPKKIRLKYYNVLCTMGIPLKKIKNKFPKWLNSF